MIRPLILTLCAGCFCLAPGEEPEDPAVEVGEQHYRIYTRAGEPASLDQLLARVRATTVTFLGESHDDPAAHYLENLILRSSYSPGQILSLEMFENDVQGVVDEYLADLISEDHLVKSGRAWKNYASDYRPLVEWAKEKGIPVVAANAPRRYVNRVSRLGTDSLDELSEEAKRSLPPLPYAAASDEYRQKFVDLMTKHREMAAKNAREAGDEEKAEELEKDKDYTKGLQAQSLWDAGMAYSIADALQRHPGASVLHVNGSFHSAEKLGILDHLHRYRPNTPTLVVTMLSAKSFPSFDAEQMADQGDFVIVTDPQLPRSFTMVPPKKKEDEDKNEKK